MARSLLVFQSKLTEANRLQTARADALAESLKAKEEFVSCVSHELRTPLTSIKGALGLMCSGKVGEVPDKVQRLLDVAHRNSDRLLLLVNDLLEMDRLEAGKVRFQMRPLDLTTLIGEAIESNQAYASAQGQTLLFTGGSGQFIVRGDRDRIMQVMANLLSNAVKFSPPGGRVEISLTRYDESIRIAVKDYGGGIPKTARATIFEKFTQADSSDSRKTSGTGLGLFITKMIVEKHKGTIDFTSEVDEGTIFYVDLPALAARKKGASEEMP